jgi:hypothetical protein
VLGDARLPLIREHAPLIARPLGHRPSLLWLSIDFKQALDSCEDV